MFNSEGEIWQGLTGWPYEVSRLGHIRRKRANKQVTPTYDKEGYAIVTLKRGPRSAMLYLDTLVAIAFHGNRHGSLARPLHLDGVPWNHWANNLRWGSKSMMDEHPIVDWIAWRDGKRLHGPMNDWNAIVGGCQPGDVILGKNKRHNIVSFEIMFSRSRPMSPRNPLDLANEYEAAAKSHNDAFWSVMLSEAAQVIRALAVNVLDRVSGGQPTQVQLPARRSNGKIERLPMPPMPTNGSGRIQRRPM